MTRARKTEEATEEPVAPSDRVVEGHEAALAALGAFEDACTMIGPDRLHSSLRTILEDYRTCRDDVTALVDRIKARAAA